jgi:cell division protein WhiA
MSFSTNIKNEITNLDSTLTESISELSAYVNINAEINDDSFILMTENLSVARRIFKIIKKLYHIDVSIDTKQNNINKKTYYTNIIVKEKASFILKDLSIINNKGKRIYIPNNYIIDTVEEKKAYLRGCFLACGSINDPKTSRYHMELLIDNKQLSVFVNNLLNEFNLNSKILKREKKYMIYIKETEKISDFIKILNAYNSLFYYEDIRIYRDHKNMTNRLNNCEQANIDKVVMASNKQIEMIQILKKKKDIELLDDKIKKLIYYREKYPDSSLEELANIISLETGKKITKSGINHRFRKIKEIINEE